MASEKPFYIRQLPKEAQAWLKDKVYKSFIADGDKEEDAQKKAEDFLDEKVYTAEEMYGKDFLNKVGKTEEPKKKMTRKIRAKDEPGWIWDDEDVFRRFAGTPFVHMADDKDRKETYDYYRKTPIEDLMKDKDIADWYEYVGDEEKVEPNNWATKELYKGGNPYEDIEDMLDEWDKEGKEPKVEKPEVKDIDTNDNGKVEVDELEAYTKDLEDYLDKNPDAKKKNYY